MIAPFRYYRLYLIGLSLCFLGVCVNLILLILNVPGMKFFGFAVQLGVLVTFFLFFYVGGWLLVEVFS